MEKLAHDLLLGSNTIQIYLYNGLRKLRSVYFGAHNWLEPFYDSETTYIIRMADLGQPQDHSKIRKKMKARED